MSKTWLKRSFFVFIALLLASRACLAQPSAVATGTYPFGSYSGGPDVVNLGNLNVHLDIPIRHKAGRGLNFDYTLSYDSSIYSSTTGAWNTLADMGWHGGGPKTFSGGSLEATIVGGQTCPNGNVVYIYWSGFVYTDAAGAVHSLPGVVQADPKSWPGQCSNDYSPTFQFFDFPGAAKDGSGITLSANTSINPDLFRPLPTDLNITMPDGVTTATTIGAPGSHGQGIVYADGTLTALEGTFDHNGNEINMPVASCATVAEAPTQYDLNGNCMALGSFTDTLGETPLAISLVTNPSNTSPTFLTQTPVDQSLTYSYTGGGSSGTSQTVLHYTPHSLMSNFGCANIAETSGPNQSQPGSVGLTLLPDKLTMPDGRYYSFTYESVREIPGSTTGRIASITFPAGGSVSYSYGPIDCSSGSVFSLTRTVDDANGNVSTWLYSRSPGQPILTAGGAHVTPWTTVVTDPSQNQQVLTFTPEDPLPPQLAGFNVYDAPPDGVGNYYPRTTVLNFYEISRVEYSGPAGSGTPMRTTLTSYNNNWATTLPITSRVVTTRLPDASGKTSQISDNYDTMGNLTQRSTYDYGAIGAGVGPLLYTESTGYQNFAGIFEFPTSMIDKNGVETRIAYDSSSPTVTSGIPQHSNENPHVGNPTVIYKPQSSAINSTIPPPVTSYTYYDTGMVATSTDAYTFAVTTYTYADCASAFPVRTSTPVFTAGSQTATLETSTTYDCKGGVSLSSTDVNGNISKAEYNDPLWRPTLMTDAVGNTVAQAYPTTQSALATTTTTYKDGTAGTYQVAGFDGFSRPVLQQSGQDANSGPYTSVASAYDWRGNAVWTSTPYMAAAGVGGTLHRYGTGLFNIQNPGTQAVSDALGRTYAVQDAGGGTALYSYSYNDVLVLKGPAAPSESIKAVQYEYDGSGQLASVCEVTSGAGSGACGQSTAATGYFTRYAYTGGLLASIHQNVQSGAAVSEPRSFAYDVLGRLVSQVLPETGSTTYQYDADFDGQCPGVYNGDVIKKVDNAGNATCSTYDNLHRLLSTAVVAGPYADSVTPQNHFVYDSATLTTGSNTIAMKQAKGKIAEAYTCNGNPAAKGTCGGPKLTDIFQSASLNASGGAPTGTTTSQLWESTPNSGGYFNTTATSYGNGVTSLLSATLGGASIGFPTVAYSLGRLGRPVDATDRTNNIPLVTFVNYHPLFGKPTEVDLGNNDIDGFEYEDLTGRAHSFTSYIGSSGVPYISGGLTWNPNGSLRNVAINDSTPGGTGTITCSYSTDDLNRLSSVDCPHSWGQNFTYDPFGNIRKDQNGVPGEQTLTYQAHYDAHNQVSSGPVASYDPNGNQTAITPSTDLQWDAAGRLVAVDIASFRPIYDAFGRVAEVYIDGNSGYDFSFAQYVYDPSGNKIAIVSSGARAEGPVALVKGTVALPGGGTAIYGPSGFSHFRHTDWLGSSRLATNWDHTVHGKQTYAPFGETYAESGNPDRSFTGQDQDTLSNMYDFPARRYDAVAGRFMSPDPSGLTYADISNPQSFNLYSYVLNNPLRNVDPTGMYCDYSDHNNAASAGDESQQDYHSSEGECTAMDENGNRGVWVNDAATHLDANGQGVDNDGRPESAISANSTSDIIPLSGDFTFNMTKAQFIEMMSQANILLSPGDDRMYKFTHFGHKGTNLRENKSWCSIHATIDPGAGENGKPVTGNFHIDSFHPFKSSNTHGGANEGGNVPNMPLHATQDVIPDLLIKAGVTTWTGNQNCPTRP